MSNNIIFMFSGQGAQYYHMGEELFQNRPSFRTWMKQLDDMVGEVLGTSILAQLYAPSHKKSDPFKRTLYTHPAIFMVEYALLQTLREEGIEPDYVLGTSMGEFAAATCAGILTLEETVEILLKQAESLESCPQGGMLAILADPNLFENEAVLHDNSELAAINFDAHFVVAGTDEKLRRIIEWLKVKNINYHLLPVSQAFHSSCIDSVSYTFTSYLLQKEYQLPRINFISGTYGKEMPSVSETYFWEIVRKPMLFQKTVRALEQDNNYIYVDLGPSGTLSNFVKYNLAADSTSRPFHIITPFGHTEKNIARLHETLAACI
jgi:trans-AT polyketide synthase/acyltransferase/oxidoreductase domain-containing protein